MTATGPLLCAVAALVPGQVCHRTHLVATSGQPCCTRQKTHRDSSQWQGAIVNGVLMSAIPEEWEGPPVVEQQLR